MSRSRRQPVYKEKTMSGKAYRKLLRNKQKSYFRQYGFIPNQLALINDYLRCDTILDFRYDYDEFWAETKRLMRRK